MTSPDVALAVRDFRKILFPEGTSISMTTGLLVGGMDTKLYAVLDVPGETAITSTCVVELKYCIFPT